MSKKTTIYVVRHGESVANANKWLSGHSNPKLTKKGFEQAHATKDKLSHIDFDIAYSSDLSRAIHTGSIIHGKPIPPSRQKKQLRERDFAFLDGQHDGVLSNLTSALMSLKPDDRWHYQHVPGMESDHMLGERFVAAIEEIAQNHPGETILVAAHGAAIRTMLMKLGYGDHESLKAHSFVNGGYVHIEYKNGVLEIIEAEGLQEAPW